MCRLALFNKKFMSVYGKEKMLGFLNQLEKSCGGHGNGILFIKDNKIELEAKGMDLENNLIVSALFNKIEEMPDWFLYHTRVASKGSVSDSNCHPYLNEDESFALMMNGTISSFGAFGKYMGDITDTEVLFKTIDTFNVDLEVLTELDPRFIGFKDGKVFASNSGGYSGLKFFEQDDCICIASESPSGVKDWDSMEDEYLWYEGKEIEKAKPRVNTNSYGNYGYYGSWQNTKYHGTYNGKKGYWLGNSFYFDEEEEKDCKSCNIEDKEYDGFTDFTKEETFKIVDHYKEKYPNVSYTVLQNLLDTYFGVMPIIDGIESDIIVFETKEVAIQDAEGNIYQA